jgi:uncharacterized cupredoxin-like copper-binding protein
MRRRTGVLLLGALTASSAGFLTAGAGGGPGDGPLTVELVVRHSRFSPERLTVPHGRPVHFVVRNLDPIDHELIIGDDAVQLRHENGTDPHHGEVPGEVSVPAGEEAVTTYVFASPGPVPFGCHLPGHWSYGMRGEVRLV